MALLCVVCLGLYSSVHTFHPSLFSYAQVQQGKATFYSKRATGARTANGERLHHDSLTCAHRTYPFGTMLKVTNLNNGKEVIVRVTDRGPFVKGRIIDLSWRAAKELGIIAQGVAMVKVEEMRERRGIPYRDDDDESVKMPKFDFEFAEYEFSISDNLKRDSLPASPHSTQIKKEAAATPKEAPATIPHKH